MKMPALLISAFCWLSVNVVNAAAQEVSVKVLASRGNPSQCDVNKQDKDGNTALAWAAGFSLKRVKVLLAAGADPNIPNNLGTTPLSSAVCMGKKDIVEELLAHGARLDVEDNEGQTVLCHAMIKFPLSTDMLRFLLAKGAKPSTNDIKRANRMAYVGMGYEPGRSERSRDPYVDAQLNLLVDAL